MHFYSHNFHCYGCGVTGDVFDLTERYIELHPGVIRSSSGKSDSDTKALAMEYVCEYAGGRSYYEVENESTGAYCLSRADLELIGISPKKTMNGLDVLCQYGVAVEFEPGEYDGAYFNGEYLIFRRENSIGLETVSKKSPSVYYEWIVKKAENAAKHYREVYDAVKKGGRESLLDGKLSDQEYENVLVEIAEKRARAEKIAGLLSKGKRRI